MVRYRVTYNASESFGFKLTQTKILEFDDAVSRKEIASKLGIAVDSIVNVAVI